MIYSKVTDYAESSPPFLIAETIPVNSSGAGGVPLKNEAPNSNDLTAFFAIGMTINVVILVAFFVWAFKQWGKKQ